MPQTPQELNDSQPDGVKLLEQALELLNDDLSAVYALTYQPTLQAWRVIRLDRVVANNVVLNDSLYKITPGATDHNYLAGAIKDALILKKGGHI